MFRTTIAARAVRVASALQRQAPRHLSLRHSTRQPTAATWHRSSAPTVQLSPLRMYSSSGGLQITTHNEPQGEVVPKGARVSVHYTGKLEDGTVFDSSVERGQPIEFQVGVGQVIRGWDEGITQLTKGQKALLVCPPEYAYGNAGAGGVIPPNATLHFEVEVVDFTA